MNRLTPVLLACLLAASACADDSPAPSGGTQDTEIDRDTGSDGAAVDGGGDVGGEPDGRERDATDAEQPDDVAEPDVIDPEMDASPDDAGDAADAEEPDVRPTGCSGPESCEEGEVCSGELGCGMPWACLARTCDADDPAVLLCSCEGRTFRAQLSCVGRPAAYVIEQVSPVPEDVMCDPDVEGPVYFDVVITGEGFAEFEGLDVHLRVQDTFRGEVAAFGTVTVVNGGFGVRFDDVFDPDLFGVILEYYVDANGNGSCDPDTDTSYSAFVNNSFDWEGQEAPVTITPEGEAPELCEIW